jgi:hypothetical protein
MPEIKLHRSDVIDSLRFAVDQMLERTEELRRSHIVGQIDNEDEYDDPQVEKTVKDCIRHGFHLLCMLKQIEATSKRKFVRFDGSQQPSSN